MITGVLLYPLFSEYELTVALSILKQGNKEIQTIGLDLIPIKGESDLTCIPDTSIRDVDLSTIDSLLLPGCMDISTLVDRNDIIDFIKNLAQKNAIMAAISSSPYLLAKAGVLENRKYTVGLLKEQRDFLGVFDEDNYSDDLVVRDGNVITARGRGFIHFGIAIGESLGLEFDPRWYVGESVGVIGDY